MIATQAKIGALGQKPTTELSWSFDSMVNTGQFQFGLNSDGIHILNSGTTDNGTVFTSSFTMATTDIGIRNPKKGRFVYVGLDCNQSEPITVSVSYDNKTANEFTARLHKSGIQRVRIPIGSRDQGRYIKLKIESVNAFRIDSIDGIFIVRSSGIRG